MLKSGGIFCFLFLKRFISVQCDKNPKCDKNALFLTKISVQFLNISVNGAAALQDKIPPCPWLLWLFPCNLGSLTFLPQLLLLENQDMCSSLAQDNLIIVRTDNIYSQFFCWIIANIVSFMFRVFDDIVGLYQTEFLLNFSICGDRIIEQDLVFSVKLQFK